MMNDNKNNKKDKNSYGLILGMCIGLAIGAAVGAATHNPGLWIPVGLCIGLALGTVFDHSSKDDDGDHTDDKQ